MGVGIGCSSGPAEDELTPEDTAFFLLYLLSTQPTGIQPVTGLTSCTGASAITHGSTGGNIRASNREIQYYSFTAARTGSTTITIDSSFSSDDLDLYISTAGTNITAGSSSSTTFTGAANVAASDVSSTSDGSLTFTAGTVGETRCVVVHGYSCSGGPCRYSHSTSN